MMFAFAHMYVNNSVFFFFFFFLYASQLSFDEDVCMLYILSSLMQDKMNHLLLEGAKDVEE
jgi:hypothetical protein